MARREEHLQDELEALQQRLDSLQRKLAQIPETKPAAAPKPAPQEPDAVAQQILAEAARTVESAEAELAGYKVEHAKQMEQVQELNAELNAEATKLRGKTPAPCDKLCVALTPCCLFCQARWITRSRRSSS